MECLHTNTEIRFKVNAAGVKNYYAQCLNCGRGVGIAIAHRKIPPTQIVLEWDRRVEDRGQELEKQRYHQLAIARERQREAESAEWWAKYTAYLQTEIWAGKRARVLERDNHRCKACERNEATQVHHLNYDHVFDEPLFDLISVCESCHKKITKMDRERREVVYGNP